MTLHICNQVHDFDVQTELNIYQRSVVRSILQCVLLITTIVLSIVEIRHIIISILLLDLLVIELLY